MVAAKVTAPTKSIRWTLAKKPEFSPSESVFLVSVGSFHKMRMRPKRVIGHCPKKDLSHSATKHQ